MHSRVEYLRSRVIDLLTWNMYIIILFIVSMLGTPCIVAFPEQCEAKIVHNYSVATLLSS